MITNLNDFDTEILSEHGQANLIEFSLEGLSEDIQNCQVLKSLKILTEGETRVGRSGGGKIRAFSNLKTSANSGGSSGLK